MTRTQKRWWEQERAKGEASFVLRQGLLRTGLPYAAIVTVAPLIYDAFNHRPVEFTWKFAIMFVFYAVDFGGCMGTMVWRERERDYQKPTEDDSGA